MTFTPYIQPSQNYKDGTSTSQQSRCRHCPRWKGKNSGVAGRVWIHMDPWKATRSTKQPLQSQWKVEITRCGSTWIHERLVGLQNNHCSHQQLTAVSLAALKKKKGFQSFQSLLKWLLSWITSRASQVPYNLNGKVQIQLDMGFEWHSLVGAPAMHVAPATTFWVFTILTI